MAVTSNQSGSQAATVTTEHNIGTAITTAGVYVFVVDCNAMVNGDRLELKIKTKVNSSATERIAYMAIFENIQTEPNKYSVPIPITDQLQCTLKQSAGTSRTFPWNILSL